MKCLFCKLSTAKGLFVDVGYHRVGVVCPECDALYFDDARAAQDAESAKNAAKWDALRKSVAAEVKASWKAAK